MSTTTPAMAMPESAQHRLRHLDRRSRHCGAVLLAPVRQVTPMTRIRIYDRPAQNVAL